jgi:DNA polymerase III alpha subunit
MIPLFKSHYSIGKSILTLDHPESCKEDGSDSIFSIASQSDLSRVTIVEDSLVGFLQAQKTCEELNIRLVFGLRLNICHKLSKDKKDNFKCTHRVIIFAKNDDGCKLLNKIYSKAFCDGEGTIENKDLKGLWDEDSLSLAIPFYDSFIFMNTLHFCSCVPEFSFTNPYFFIEQNYLPFDLQVANKVRLYCENNNFESVLVKSVYYKDKKDFKAFQTYKCICNRRYKQRTLSVPNIDHLASPEFCWESYLENNESS